MLKLLCAATAVFTLATAAQAETLQCAQGLIEEGASRQDVLEHCGEPGVRRLMPPALLRRGPAPGAGPVAVERWVYGPAKGFYQQVRFIDGRVVEISSERS
ncbi:DUF2845 domain-containing protein [Pseudomonas sp. NPDC007930]|uniref:DUF2845 domain-containing protein n=1 Tax=Pseudomonas sp. NPDC007930 TaxID=3364417 RepID=UPI0036EE6957